jgi:structural maintenance of chromosome 1
MNAVDEKESLPLRMEKLKIQNFKSFTNETLIGPFGDFACIVGPNGCGKSNIVSSLLFLFGLENIKIENIFNN